MTQNETDTINRNGIEQEKYTTLERFGQPQPVVIRKRIGSTTYRVSVHFSGTSTETISDKIDRLIRREAAGA